MGEKMGGGFNYFCLNWGRPQTEKYVTTVHFLILSYSLSKYLIKPFAYAIHHRNTVGINNNHFEYWSPVLVPLLIYNKKCNKLNVGGGWVLSFLDEGGGVLKIKVLRLGAALKNVQYLVFTTHRPPSHY